mmetsp:Transcript_65732/g.169167  ORF Transcript_65732/g.169167 Transcript_65732/m.169167 type:complete len:338 (-) Transcript_65732:33-1046(-)
MIHRMPNTDGKHPLHSDAQGVLGAVVEHEDERAANAAHDVGKESLVQACGQALLRRDLLEAIHRALVQVLLHRLLRLHLQTTAHGVEGVGGTSTDRDRGLGRGEGARGTQNAFVLLVRVNARDGVEGAQLQATVAHNAHNGDSEAGVEAEEALRPLHGLHDAVTEAGEALLAGAHIAGKARSRIVQRVHDRHAARSRQATGDEVRAEELPKLRLRVVLREHGLEGVLECQVEGLRGEVADAVREVAIPEALEALLRDDTRTAIHHALVPRDLATADLRVGILSLDHQLDALNRRRERLRNGAGEAAEDEVDHERLHLAVRHGCKRLLGKLVCVRTSL